MTHVIVPYPDVCHNPIAASGARYQIVGHAIISPGWVSGIQSTLTWARFN